MENKRLTTFLGLTFLLLFAFAMPAYGGDGAPRISTEELKGMLGSADLVLLDVRTTKDWKKSDIKISGAVRVDPKDVSSWVGNYGKEQEIVLYCAWKNEGTSASVAQELIKQGYKDVKALKGGWKEWLKKGFPTEPK